MGELFIESSESGPDTGSPLDQKRETATLADLSREFHLFTLGPVYVGANIPDDFLKVFYEDTKVSFGSILSEQPHPMFQNLKEWDFLVQGIEKHHAERFSRFLQNWDFVNRDTKFFSKIYSRPVQIVQPGTVRGVSVEVHMLMSNKGTQVLTGANPYIVTVDPSRISAPVKRDAGAVFEVMGETYEIGDKNAEQ